MRPTWDEYGLAMAQTATIRAACIRRQVGAVILTSEGIIRGAGYNGTAAGKKHCTDGGCPRGLLSYAECPPLGSYSNCTGFHAEHNAIKNSNGPLQGCAIYITREPCDDCQALIRSNDIVKAVWPDGELRFD